MISFIDDLYFKEQPPISPYEDKARVEIHLNITIGDIDEVKNVVQLNILAQLTWWESFYMFKFFEWEGIFLCSKHLRKARFSIMFWHPQVLRTFLLTQSQLANLKSKKKLFLAFFTFTRKDDLLYNQMVSFWKFTSDDVFFLFKCRYDWRLTFINLKEGWNVLSKADSKKIWIPKVVFENDKKRTYIKNGELSVIKVIKTLSGKISFNFHLHEHQEFKGLYHPLWFENIYELKLSCELELHFYPFDSQQCFIEASCSIVFVPD